MKKKLFSLIYNENNVSSFVIVIRKMIDSHYCNIAWLFVFRYKTDIWNLEYLKAETLEYLPVLPRAICMRKRLE